MSIRNLAIAAAAIALSVPAGAAEIVRSLPAGDAPEVRIINAVGDVVVNGAKTDEIGIVADLGRRAERLDVSERGDTVVIEVIYESGKGGWRNDGTDLVVTLPENSRVAVNAVSADVRLSGVRGRDVRVQAVSGDIDVETYGGVLEAESTSGDVSVRGHLEEGEARVGSTSGDVEVEGLAGRLQATAVSGDVSIRDGQLDRVRAQTTSGDVFVHGLRGTDTDIEAGAVSGDVEVMLSPGFGGRIDVATLNGRIDNCFGPKAKRTSRYGPGRTLNFDHGEGRGRVRIETVNGGVELCIE